MLGYTLLAVVFVLDKRILTNEKQPPIVYTFYSSIFLLLVGLAWFFVPLSSDPKFWLVSVVSGLTFTLGLWAMFVAVSKSEASHIDPFIGAVITTATFFSARFFLNETLSLRQTAGIFLLIVASVFLAREKTQTNQMHWRWYGLGIIAGILFAISNVSGKYLYDTFSFLPGLIGSKFTAGWFALLLLFFPTVRNIFFHPKKAKTIIAKHKQPVGLVLVDKILGVIAILLLQWATAVGSVTAVNALAGLQYALMFVIILILSKYGSKFLQEYMTKQEIVLQSFALLLVFVGLVLVI